MEFFEFASVTYCTNIPRGTYPSDDEAEFVAVQVSEMFQAKLSQSSYAEDITVVRVEYSIGCVLTTITLAATVGALYKFIKEYPKFRPGLILLLKDINGVYVQLRDMKNKGSTYHMNDDIPDSEELKKIVEECNTGKRKSAKKTQAVRRKSDKQDD